jgi:acetolactate synthase-1/2/3 large subunit
MEAAEHLACALRARGITRIFGLEGGHIQPLWDHLARIGVEMSARPFTWRRPTPT